MAPEVKPHPYRIFVSGLSKTHVQRYDGSGIVEEDNLGYFFYDRGCKVEDVRLMVDPSTSKCRGFGFVDFTDEESFGKALALAGTQDPEGVKLDPASQGQLKVEAAKPAQPVARDKHQELAKARDQTEDMERALRWREANVRELEAELHKHRERQKLMDAQRTVEVRLAEERQRQDELRLAEEKLAAVEEALRAALTSEQERTRALEAIAHTVDEEHRRPDPHGAEEVGDASEEEAQEGPGLELRIKNTFIEFCVPKEHEHLVRTRTAPSMVSQMGDTSAPSPTDGYMEEGGATSSSQRTSPLLTMVPAPSPPAPWALKRDSSSILRSILEDKMEAESERDAAESRGRSASQQAKAAPMFFPMYTVSVDVLLQMRKVEPHEELKARGELTVFSDGMGRAAFVSHQWLAADHPDPDFKQMRGLQDAVKRLRCGRGSVSLDQVTESYVRTAKPIPMHEFQVQALFVWYDYFSCPQLEERKSFGADETDGSQQASAINSIPAYVAKCRFFLALCPVLDCPFVGKVLTAATWSRRGWCRLERAARELSRDSSWILIRSDTSMEVVGTVLSFPSAAVGEGDFTVADDRQKLAPVMRQILVQKLSQCLRAGDLPGFRRHFNLQAVHLRGLEIESVSNPLQRSDGDSVAEFLHQNGLRRVDEADTAGWRPLHYAALAGNTRVLKGLLEQRADLNRRTSKDEPMLGFPAWTSVLEIATFYKHHEATRWLLAARARLGGGRTGSPIAFAAISDNEEGIRLLCMAGLKPLDHNLFGHTNLEAAASYAASSALEELVLQGRPDPLELSRALWAAATFRGGSAELVLHLIKLRADINFQFNLPRDYRPLGRLVVVVKSLQHRLGSASMMTAFAYHLHGSTPLMQAVKSAQFEAAAALLAADARLDLRNCRNWAAADFARGQSIPHFLQLGLEGNASECRRVSSLAMADGYVEGRQRSIEKAEAPAAEAAAEDAAREQRTGALSMPSDHITSWADESENLETGTADPWSAPESDGRREVRLRNLPLRPAEELKEHIYKELARLWRVVLNRSEPAVESMSIADHQDESVASSLARATGTEATIIFERPQDAKWLVDIRQPPNWTSAQTMSIRGRVLQSEWPPLPPPVDWRRLRYKADTDASSQVSYDTVGTRRSCSHAIQARRPDEAPAVRKGDDHPPQNRTVILTGIAHHLPVHTVRAEILDLLRRLWNRDGLKFDPETQLHRGAEGGLTVRHSRRPGQENDGSCVVRLRNYCDAKWLVEQARGLSIEGRPLRAMWARPRDGGR
eukprot:s356_g12.t1